MTPTHRIKYQGTALPEDTDTELLWSTVDSLFTDGGAGRYLGLAWFVAAIWNSHAGTVNAYFSNDKGTTWRLFQTETYSALGADSNAAAANIAEFYIEPYEHVKFEWVNGGDTQTIFDPALCTTNERSPSQ